MNYACYASEQSAIENFWHNEKRLNSYRSFGCTALPGVYLISDWAWKSPAQQSSNLFFPLKRSIMILKQEQRKNTFMTYHPLAIWVSISMLLWKVVLCHSISGWLSEGWFQCTHYNWTASSIAQPIWPYYLFDIWHLEMPFLCKSYNFLRVSYWHLGMVVAKSILSKMISWCDE